MQLLAPDILADARGLSSALHVTGLIVGLALWARGWRNYRFWVVLVITVSAGTYGLAEAGTLHTAPLLAALLLSVAAGVLALSMIRLVAFAAGGLVGLVAVQALAPGWEQPLIAFLLGGLLGHLLFRLWLMALTSFCGMLLMSYTGLCLLDRLGKLDAVAWTEKRTLVLNGLCGAVAALGFVVQIVLDRRRGRKADGNKGKSSSPKSMPKPEKPSEKPARSWGQTLFRKAG